MNISQSGKRWGTEKNETKMLYDIENQTFKMEKHVLRY